MESDRPASARNIWVATVRPDGRPHLVPIWFVVAEGGWYFVTEPNSVKARNLQHDSRIALSLEDGSDPLVVEGEARVITPNAEVIRLFKEKYNWDITSDSQYSQTFEVTVHKHVMGKE